MTVCDLIEEGLNPPRRALPDGLPAFKRSTDYYRELSRTPAKVDARCAGLPKFPPGDPRHPKKEKAAAA